MNIENYSMLEADIAMALISGGDFQGVSAGALCKNLDGSLLRVIGFVKDKFAVGNVEEIDVSFDKANCQLAVCASLVDNSISTENYIEL